MEILYFLFFSIRLLPFFVSLQSSSVFHNLILQYSSSTASPQSEKPGRGEKDQIASDGSNLIFDNKQSLLSYID